MSRPPSAGRVFICYRRQETAYAAGWLFDRLVERFGRGQIFKDVDSIQLGDDFVEVLSAAVGSCDVLLALIGDQWLTIADEQGTPCLDDPDDFVRLEIEAALLRDVRVIPILVAGAQMPRADELPLSLAKLTRRQALELSPSSFDADIRQLLRVVENTLAEAQPQPRPGGPVVKPGRGGLPGGPDRAPGDARSGERAGVARARRRRQRRRVLIVAAAGALVAAVVTGALALLPGPSPGTEPAGRPITVAIRVASTEVWTDTQIDCEVGDVLDIAATGTIFHAKGASESETGPEGFDDPVYHQYNVAGLPDANFAALIGSIGGEQPFFVVGRGTTYECRSAGRLFLGVNDVGIENNSGYFDATITRRA